MRIWAKMYAGTHLVKDMVAENFPEDLSRTGRVFKAVDEFCYVWDLAKPIWLDKNITEFQKHSKTRFYQDNFPEHIDFDFVELHVIEE